MKGMGSLAHEWFHSLDNLLSESQGVQESTGDMLTEAPDTIENETLKSAFGDLIGAMTTGKTTAYKPFDYTDQDYKNNKNPKVGYGHSTVDMAVPAIPHNFVSGQIIKQLTVYN